MVIDVVRCHTSSLMSLPMLGCMIVACGRPGSEPPTDADVRAADPVIPDVPVASGAEDDTSMEAVWATAIVAPDGDEVFVVDSFVAGWLFARAAAGSVPEWEPIDARADAEPAGGYRLMEVPSGSPYTQLGLQEGDIVESLNGVVLTGPDRFGFALDGAESLVVLSVFRGGVTSKRQYQLVAGATWSRQLADYAGDPDPTVVAEAPLFEDAPAGTAEAEPPTAGRTGRASPTRPSAGSRSSSRPRGSAGSPPSRRAGSTAKPAKVRCSSSSKCTIDAAHFRQLVSAPSRLQSQVDVVPAIRNDVFSGYRIKRVRPGSDAAHLGFRAGDKITHINGRDLTNDAEALGLYMSLGASRLFKIRYERNGKRHVKTVTVS